MIPDTQVLNLVSENDNENSQIMDDIETEIYMIPDKNSIDNSQIIQEDNEPVDSFTNEKLQRLLSGTLYNYTLPNKLPFIVCADVGIFFQSKKPPLVPDVFLSLNVTIPDDGNERNIRSYLVWEFGKLPEIVIEIISPTYGEEMGRKFRKYAQLGVKYYVVYDPTESYSSQILRIFELENRQYVPLKNDRNWFPEVGLGLTFWSGNFEGKYTRWLRWCDENGNVIPTTEELGFSLTETKTKLTESETKLTESETKLTEFETKLTETKTKLTESETKLTEFENKTRKTLLSNLQVGLKLKFGNEGEVLFLEISQITDIDVLNTLTANYLSVNTIEEIRKMYS